MRKKFLVLGATAIFLAGCGDQTVAEMLNNQKKEVKTEQVAKQEEKIIPEVKIIGENGVGAGIIVKKEDSTLYIVTNCSPLPYLSLHQVVVIKKSETNHLRLSQ